MVDFVFTCIKTTLKIVSFLSIPTILKIALMYYHFNRNIVNFY